LGTKGNKPAWSKKNDARGGKAEPGKKPVREENTEGGGPDGERRFKGGPDRNIQKSRGVKKRGKNLKKTEKKGEYRIEQTKYTGGREARGREDQCEY